jgi:hypothetical protein
MAAGRGALTVVGLMVAVIVAASFFLGVGSVLAPASVNAPASAVPDHFYFPVQGPSDQDALGQVP